MLTLASGHPFRDFFVDDVMSWGQSLQVPSLDYRTAEMTRDTAPGFTPTPVHAGSGLWECSPCFLDIQAVQTRSVKITVYPPHSWFSVPHFQALFHG